MATIDDGFFDKVQEHLSVILGIVELSLAMDERMRLEDTLRIRDETLKISALVRKQREKGNWPGNSDS
ncbi:MAG: hypothetical protein ACE5H9_08095 [Anaerolineae bacterium]